MTLNKTLQEMKAASRSRVSPDAAAIMARAAEQLERSEIVRNALKKGATAPAFELLDGQGNSHNSTRLLARGPLILHFYRGSW